MSTVSDANKRKRKDTSFTADLEDSMLSPVRKVIEKPDVIIEEPKAADNNQASEAKSLSKPTEEPADNLTKTEEPSIETTKNEKDAEKPNIEENKPSQGSRSTTKGTKGSKDTGVDALKAVFEKKKKKDRGVQRTFYYNKEQSDYIDAVCEKTGIGPSDFVRFVLQEFMDNNKI